jgi:hypothetical protein
MSDDIERRLDELYRKLSPSARRIEGRWRSKLPSRSDRTPSSGSTAAWLGAGVAAAAAILLMILALRSGERTPTEPLVKLPPPPATELPPRLTPEAPAPPPVLPKPAPEHTPRPEPAPRQTPPTPEEPRVQEPPPAPQPESPKRDEQVPTRVSKAVALLRETDGSFEFAEKPVRGKQKDFPVTSGDRLRAVSTVRITLAEDRTILLAPRTVLEFRPEEKCLTLSLDQGELVADLIGPGPEIRVATKACEISPLGTVFGVKADPGRVLVLVEKGRVNVRGSKGRATLRAAESLQASEDGALGPIAPADFRPLAWARGHRPPELTLFLDDFSKPGAWIGEIEKGVARAVPMVGGGSLIHLETEKPIFEVPIRGVLTLVCRTDRASKLKVQLFAADVRTTYKKEVPLLRGPEWRTLSLNFEDFVSTDRMRAPGRVPPGSPVTDLLLLYGEEEERGSFWVNSIKVTEWRP